MWLNSEYSGTRVLGYSQGAQADYSITAITAHFLGPVLDGFLNVTSQNIVTTGQVRNRACDFDNPMVGARRQTEAIDGLSNHTPARFIQSAISADLTRCQLGIDSSATPSKPLPL